MSRWLPRGPLFVATILAIVPSLPSVPSVPSVHPSPSVHRSIQQAPLFKSHVNVIEVDASVLDASRRPIHGLTSADFVVLEDGKPQPVVSFSEVTVPDPEDGAGTWMREVAPDVRTNNAEDGRVLVLLLDDALISGEFRTNEVVDNIRTISNQIIERLGPTDQMAVLSTFDKRFVQDFTSDHARLHAIVDKFTPKRFSVGTAKGFRPGETWSFNAGDTFRYDSLDAFRNVAQYLAQVPQRRKAIIFVTPFDEPKLSDEEIKRRRNSPTPDLVTGRIQDEFEHAQRSGVTVYSINPGTRRETIAAAEGEPDDATLTILKSLEARRPSAPLGTLSSVTGGFAIGSAPQVAAGVAQIFRETGSYYLLGYSPDTLPADGVLRKIDVSVNRRGAIVRSRTGYYSPKATVVRADADPLAVALSAVLPNPGLSMRATAAAFAVPGKSDARIAVAVGVTEAPPRAAVTDRIDMQVRAFTQRGDPQGIWTQAVDVGLNPNRAADADVHFDVLAGVVLAPGVHELRISAHSTALDRSGSVYITVEVPEFSNAALSLSGIALTATPSPGAAPKDALAAFLPVAPTTTREFTTTTHATAFLRVYQKGKPLTATVTTTILDRTGQTINTQVQTIAETQFDKSRSADYRAELPLQTLRPGPYLLKISAKAGAATATRDVRFTIK